MSGCARTRSSGRRCRRAFSRKRENGHSAVLLRARPHVAIRSDNTRGGKGLAGPAFGKRTERRDAVGARHRGEPRDLCGAWPPKSDAASLYRDARSRDAAHLSPAMAGRAGERGAVARRRHPARSQSGPRGFDRLRSCSLPTPRRRDGRRRSTSSARSSVRVGSRSSCPTAQATPCRGRRRRFRSSRPIS